MMISVVKKHRRRQNSGFNQGIRGSQVRETPFGASKSAFNISNVLLRRWQGKRNVITFHLCGVVIYWVPGFSRGCDTLRNEPSEPTSCEPEQ